MVPQQLGEDRGGLYEMAEENNRLIKENNRLLNKLHRAQVASFWLRVVLLLVFIGAPLFLYQYYLKDYVGGVFEMYTGLAGSTNDILDSGLLEKLNGILGSGAGASVTKQ